MQFYENSTNFLAAVTPDSGWDPLKTAAGVAKAAGAADGTDIYASAGSIGLEITCLDPSKADQYAITGAGYGPLAVGYSPEMRGGLRFSFEAPLTAIGFAGLWLRKPMRVRLTLATGASMQADFLPKEIGEAAKFFGIVEAAGFSVVELESHGGKHWRLSGEISGVAA